MKNVTHRPKPVLRHSVNTYIRDKRCFSDALCCVLCAVWYVLYFMCCVTCPVCYVLCVMWCEPCAVSIPGSRLWLQTQTPGSDSRLTLPPLPRLCPGPGQSGGRPQRAAADQPERQPGTTRHTPHPHPHPPHPHPWFLWKVEDIKLLFLWSFVRFFVRSTLFLHWIVVPLDSKLYCTEGFC